MIAKALRALWLVAHNIRLPQNRGLGVSPTDRFRLWEMAKEDTAGRELKALRAARDELDVKDCTVVTWDSDYETADGIRVVPVWRWCLT